MPKVYQLLSTGLPGMDGVLQGVRPGDNIVWQVDSVDDYIPFVHPFCRNAVSERRKLIYFRYAAHQALLPDDVQAEIFTLHPEDGFESFIDAIFRKIETFGIGACYVFDILSELAVDWYSDRMLGNFFMLACPYLYDFETAAYFGLMKDRHTALAVNAIHGTAQVIVDVFRNRDRLYVHPLKVYKRHSETMYMLHQHNENGTFTPVTQSGVISEVLASITQPWLDFSVHRFDLWTRTFTEAQERSEPAREGHRASGGGDSLLNRLLRMAVTRDPRLIALAERYLDLPDLVNIGKRMIGTGLIGGKSAGMLVAQAILRKSNPVWRERLSVLDSFFIGSDVYYTYLIRNNCWWVRRKSRDPEEIFDNAEEARQRVLGGTFPEDILVQFREMLNYFGQSPIIVRSSSLLEDAFGNSFSGKYESVFCANQGTPQQRLESFMDAVRTVYASTLNREALSYRAHWGLLDKDEQMALLVQRVSGAFKEGYFYPHLAGVGFSFNPFVWRDEIDPRAGMLRLVFGLGTRAVDRLDDDYTRIVSLSAPLRRPEGETDGSPGPTQRFVDVLDLTANRLVTLEFGTVVPSTAENKHMDFFISNDESIDRRAREHGLDDYDCRVLTFEKLLGETSFAQDMRDMMSTLEAAYEHPVDVEFTGNIHDDGSLRIGLVQCRPFQIKKKREHVMHEGTSGGREILRTSGPIIGNGLFAPLDRLIYVVPSGYSSLGDNDRYAVARLVGRLVHLNDHQPEKHETIMLLGPGRWGTSTPSLGVPVTFSEINKISVLCEIAVMHEGLIPDISLGTHFFNDLVETDMLYMAIFPEKEGNMFDRKFLETVPNRLSDLVPEALSWSDIIRVIDTSRHSLYINVDTYRQAGSCFVAEREL